MRLHGDLCGPWDCSTSMELDMVSARTCASTKVSRCFSQSPFEMLSRSHLRFESIQESLDNGAFEGEHGHQQ